jgi:NAD(P)-dependent dehydrogenase (short-subunit alcohol dehydrogenase family)
MRNVVVMGGASSVGLAIAEAFLAAGDRVSVADVNAAAIDLLAGRPTLQAAPVDATDPEAVDTFLATVLAAGPIEVLVNCVGLPGPRAPIEAVGTQEWLQTLAGSVGAAFYAIRRVVPGMKRLGRGAIVNFSSASTRTGLPLRTPYVTAKWAVEGMTRNLARELGPHGVRVNAILPGAIDNARMRGLLAHGAEVAGKPVDTYKTELLSYISTRSMVTVDELAAMCVYLASDVARNVTGQLIGVDGNAEWEA